MHIQIISSIILTALLALNMNCTIGSVLLTEVDDRVITTSTVTLLVEDLDINNFDIKVFTDEGEVFLTGRVDRFEQREKSENHARSIKNVWSVINLLKVGIIKSNANPTRYDKSIEQSIAGRMIKHGQVPYVSVTVRSFEGEVLLIGRVGSNEDRIKLIDICENTLHVKKIHNFLKAGKKM